MILDSLEVYGARDAYTDHWCLVEWGIAAGRTRDIDLDVAQFWARSEIARVVVAEIERRERMEAE